MKRPLICTLGLCLAIIFLAVGCGKRHIDEGTLLTVLYSSDTRGKLDGCGCKNNRGGITKRAARLEAARDEDKTVLYVETGNQLSGSAGADKTRIDAVLAAYEQLQPAALNVSERDLAFGVEEFRRAKATSKLPFVSANIRYNGNAIAEPFIMATVKGANVAIVGLCGTKEVMRSDSAYLPAGVTIKDPLAAARDVLPSLAGRSDVIILLSTCGDAMDSVLAQTFQMLSVIAGGRSYRANSDSPWTLGSTRIVRTQRDGQELGRIDLVFGDERKIKTFSARRVTLDMSDPSSEGMLALMQSHIPSFVDNPTEGVVIKSQAPVEATISQTP